MRTPAGTECRYYYEDYNRGRETQECRVIKANRHSLPWQPDLCGKCRVPSILMANGSAHLRLQVTVRKRFGLFTKIDVDAHCQKHGLPIADPYRGCEACVAEVVSGDPA